MESDANTVSEMISRSTNIVAGGRVYFDFALDTLYFAEPNDMLPLVRERNQVLTPLEIFEHYSHQGPSALITLTSDLTGVRNAAINRYTFGRISQVGWMSPDVKDDMETDDFSDALFRSFQQALIHFLIPECYAPIGVEQERVQAGTLSEIKRSKACCEEEDYLLGTSRHLFDPPTRKCSLTCTQTSQPHFSPGKPRHHG